MRAAAPSALSGGLSKSSLLTGGQQPGIRPPEKTVIGLVALFSNWPSCVLHSFSLQACNWSLPRPRKVQMVLGGAAAGAGAGATAGPTRSWAGSAGARLADSTSPTQHFFHIFMTPS